MSFMKMSWDTQAAVEKTDLQHHELHEDELVFRLVWGKIDIQHHELHEDELGYASCYGERLTFSIMSFMKMSWDMQAAMGKD